MLKLFLLKLATAIRSQQLTELHIHTSSLTGSSPTCASGNCSRPRHDEIEPADISSSRIHGYHMILGTRAVQIIRNLYLSSLPSIPGSPFNPLLDIITKQTKNTIRIPCFCHQSNGMYLSVSLFFFYLLLLQLLLFFFLNLSLLSLICLSKPGPASNTSCESHTDRGFCKERRMWELSQTSRTGLEVHISKPKTFLLYLYGVLEAKVLVVACCNRHSNLCPPAFRGTSIFQPGTVFVKN